MQQSMPLFLRPQGGELDAKNVLVLGEEGPEQLQAEAEACQDPPVPELVNDAGPNAQEPASHVADGPPESTAPETANN